MKSGIAAQRAAPGTTAPRSRFRVAVIGAGFSGLSVAHALVEAGIRDFVVLERANSIGGVWRDNTYPGVACDVPSHLYSLSFAPNPGWRRAFSSGEEIRNYLEWVAASRGLAPFIRLGEKVEDALWDPESLCWRIETDKGSLSADVLVGCSGPLTEPVFPDVPGLGFFEGRMLHTNRWDSGYDFSGGRVAVIGTGASAVQVVPELQKVAERLIVVQRTPGWVVPRPNREVSSAERRLLAAVPALAKAMRARQFLVRDLLNYRMIRRNPVIRRAFERASRSLLERQVKDPELRRRLTPGYEIGCKRVLVSSDFYPALAAPNTELLTGGLCEVRPRSVVTPDGSEREVDAMVFATGFETSSPEVYKNIRGRDGRSMSEVWGGRPRLHRATTVAGFPNFFNLCGPGTGSGHGSMVFKAEAQTAYLLRALRTMERRNIATLEVRQTAEDRYMDRTAEDLEKTVWAKGGCRSWYLDAGGAPTLMWPRTMWGFRRMLGSFDAENYLPGYARGPERNVEQTEGGSLL